MPAQSGGAVVLFYGAQPSVAQPGGDVELIYSGAGGVGQTVRLTTSTHAPWNASGLLAHSVRATAPANQHFDLPTKAPWQVNTRLGAPQHQARWTKVTLADHTQNFVHLQMGKHLPLEHDGLWGKSKPADATPVTPWGKGGKEGRASSSAPWGLARPNDLTETNPWGEGKQEFGTYLGIIGPSKPADETELGIWTKYSQQLRPEWGIPGGVDPEPEPHPGPIIVPVLRSYIVINDVTLTRVDGSLSIPATAVSIEIDSDSWTWGFSATVPANYLSSLQPAMAGEAVEVMAKFNGVDYLMLVESVSRSREFGKSYLSVKGRGHSAYLSAPYSPIRTMAQPSVRTGQQLFNEALTINGVSLGWSVDWGIDDWLVPGNVWTASGPYMDVCKDLVDSVGAYIIPHRTEKILKVRHRYPFLPRDWATGDIDIVLPSAVVINEGIEWKNKPKYDSVYVAGTKYGVAGRVRIAGTPGDTEAPMAVHDLITDAMAARMRGRAILGNTGSQAEFSLSLPVLPSTGIIEPGLMVRYTDNGVPVVGITRGVQASSSGQPTLRQTIRMETHYG